MKLIRSGLSTLIAWGLRKMLRSDRFMRLTRRLPFHLRILGRTWITRHDEAAEVLRRQRDFGMPYAARMEQLGTPFILGVNPGEDYDRQRERLVSAMDSLDPGTVATSAGIRAGAALAGCGGQIDLIEKLTDVVLADTMGPALWSGDGLTCKEVGQARAVARDIFINPLGDPDVRAQAQTDAPLLRAYALDLVTRREQAAPWPGPPDVLGTLLAGASGPDRQRQVVNDLLGLMVAWVTSVSRTMGFAFDELLSPARAAQLAQAQTAARNGDATQVGAILFEALRFNPSMPALDRVCTRETRLNGTTIPRGRNLWVVLTSVMMDPHGFPDPEAFREGGPGREYLHFGHAGRVCLGKQVAQRQMEAISVELLRCTNLRRTSKLKLDGPLPKSLGVAFEEGPS